MGKSCLFSARIVRISNAASSQSLLRRYIFIKFSSYGRCKKVRSLIKVKFITTRHGLRIVPSATFISKVYRSLIKEANNLITQCIVKRLRTNYVLFANAHVVFDNTHTLAFRAIPISLFISLPLYFSLSLSLWSFWQFCFYYRFHGYMLFYFSFRFPFKTLLFAFIFCINR